MKLLFQNLSHILNLKIIYDNQYNIDYYSNYYNTIYFDLSKYIITNINKLKFNFNFFKNDGTIPYYYTNFYIEGDETCEYFPNLFLLFYN